VKYMGTLGFGHETLERLAESVSAGTAYEIIAPVPQKR
jgi:hypothetical protein